MEARRLRSYASASVTIKSWSTWSGLPKIRTRTGVGMQASVGNRVLMLLENNPYPQDSRVRREAKTLTDAGYQVTIICPSDPKQPWRELVDGVRVYRYPAPPSSSGVLGYLWEY